MFDIIGVTQRADQALVKNLSNPEESRQIYLEEIMDWTDNYTENNLSLSSSVEAKDALSNIVKLWIAYCTMEISLRQFKQAVKIFEDAISDPVASRSALIYLAYVDYCKTRGKLANAQKVYIKGLSSSLAQDEADKLWESFLPFIRSQGSPSLSMSQLYEAVRNEAGIDSLTPPRIETTEQVAGTCTSETSTDSVLETPIDSIKNSNNSNTSQNLVDIDASSLMTIEESYVDAECKIEEVNNGSSSIIDSSSSDPVDRTEMVIVKDEKIDSMSVEDKILEKEMDSHLIKREGSTTVDIPNDTDNSSSSATAVTDTFVNPGGVGDDLDSVIGMTPEQLTRMYRLRPPMLFSAPNKEPTVFGTSSLSPTDIEELEAFLGVPLTSIRYGDRQDKADAYLDLVEGLWTAQALKERHFDSWFTDLKRIHEKEGRELSRACEDKEKEAGPTQPLESLKEKSQTDRKRFRSRCAVQREVLHSVVNKTVYSLLMDQQRALVAAGFPRFSSSVMERIQMAMLAVRNGDASGGTPAAGGQPASNFDPTLLKDIAEQKKIMCALLSFRVNLAPNPNQRAGGSGRRDGSDAGQGAFPPLMRGSSVGSDFHSGGQNSKSDYYSQDAKQQRKAKRRKFYPAEGGDEIRFDDRRMRVDNGGYDSRRPGQGGQQGQGQGQGNSYQGPDHLRRGPIRRGTVAGAAGRGPAQRNGSNSNSGGGTGTGGGTSGGVDTSSQQNQKIPPSVSNVTQAPTSLLKSDEEVPLTLLQKLATMIQKVKK